MESSDHEPLTSDLSNQSILVTGATGFVGRALISHLKTLNPKALVTLSRGVAVDHGDIRHVSMDLSPDGDYREVLSGINTVIHLGGMSSVGSHQEAEAFRVNAEATVALAQQAEKAGVQRFIFISTLKVLGEEASSSSPFTETSPLRPESAYAMTKAEAESQLLALTDQPGFEMKVVIIRPPLVYGPHVKGSFRTLLALAETRFPLPLSGVSSPRSMVYLGNLVDFIHCCALADLPDNAVLHVSDDEPLSLSELISLIRDMSGRSPLLLPFPIRMFSMLLRLLGKKRMAQQLFSPFVVSDQESRCRLNWQPPFSLQYGLKETVNTFNQERQS